MSTEQVEVGESEALTSLPGSVLGQLAKAELDQKIVTAKSFPRSISRFQRECEQMVTLSADVAEECIYALPRGGKVIEGPSARFAEIVASAWGNCRAGARVISEDPEFVTAQGLFYDLERNVEVSYEVRRRITDSKNKRYNADMIGVTANAACSIALRNAVFKGVPKAFWSQAYEKARQTIKGDVKTLVERRSKVVEFFGRFGITVDQICATLDVAGLDDVGLDQLVILQGIATAIKEGDTTPEQAFAIPTKTGEPAQAGKGVAGLKSVLEGDPEPTPAGPAAALDRRTNGSTDATETAAATGSAPNTGSTGGTDASEPVVDVVKPMNDVERKRTQLAIAKALGRRGVDVGGTAQALTDITGRSVDAIANLTDAELRSVADHFSKIDA